MTQGHSVLESSAVRDKSANAQARLTYPTAPGNYVYDDVPYVYDMMM
jgi:hypothetical protein